MRIACLFTYLLLLTFLPKLLQAQTLSYATDSISINLDSAEVIFIKNNVDLLAQQFNIRAAKAEELQARLWNNPNISVSQGAYDPADKKWFELNSSGETAVQLQQLILLAGKRNKQIKMAQLNYQLSQDNFYELLRTLSYALRTDFYNIYYQQQSAKVYDEEIRSLQTLLHAYAAAESKGFISQKEVIRIQALLFSLQSEYTDLMNNIFDKESELRLLLHLPGKYIIPAVDEQKVDSLQPEDYSLQTLVDTAYQDRADLQISKQNLSLSKENYAYQKSLAVPDITLGAGYDKNGSYVHNATFLSAAIDLPFFNRNQGNIQAAKSAIAYSDLQLESMQQTIAEQVNTAYQKAIEADKLYHSIHKNFPEDFKKMMQEVFVNYQKRNISLLDFIDFYDSYKQTVLDLNTLRYNRISALEEINYVTGKNFYDQ